MGTEICFQEEIIYIWFGIILHFYNDDDDDDNNNNNNNNNNAFLISLHSSLRNTRVKESLNICHMVSARMKWYRLTIHFAKQQRQSLNICKDRFDTTRQCQRCWAQDRQVAFVSIILPRES
jgi:hypothetical protein